MTLFIQFYVAEIQLAWFRLNTTTNDMLRGDTMILIKKNLSWIFLKNTPTCSQESNVFQKNKNNSVERFIVGQTGQKCQKFSLLGRLLKFTESVDQYLMHVNFSKSPNFHQFFGFFNWLPPPPIFSTGDIIR